MKKRGLTALAALLCALPAWAQEPDYPEAAFTDRELQAVQQWEATWAGKRIDAGTVDQVADYLPPSIVKLYKEQETWRAPAGGFYFMIAPYRRVVETPGMIAATRKNAQTARLNENGLLVDYDERSGIPFPHPRTGLEVAWNYDFNTRGDASQYRRYTPTVEVKLHAERPQDADCWELFFAHRVDRDPRPRITENQKGIHWAGFYHMYKPSEYAGTRRYNLRYLDPNKADDQWMYNSVTRRLTRLSAAQRTDYVEGSIVIYDDEFCWNGHINSNTYTLAGSRELLVCRHTDIVELERENGQSLFNNLSRERLKTLVVEVVSKDEGYVYGKRVWYVDPETYIILATEIYDRRGRLWKYIEQFTQDLKTDTGDVKNYIVGCHVVDLQRTWAAVSTQAVRGVGIGVSPYLFTVSNLQRTY
jgi:hypothetical protein